MNISDVGIAVVTGSSAGIGKVYADRLARRGYDLILIARRKDRLEELAQQLQRKYGVTVEVISADLAKEEDLKNVGEVLSNNSRITLLVNNAGTAEMKPSAQIPFDVIEQQMKVNAKAVSYLSLALLPAFLKRNSGTLINIGSVLSFFALPFSTSYSATKAHVMLFTIGLRDELADTGIRVQLVLPASTDTEIWDVAGIGVHALDPQSVMSAEDCVDAALSGLDQGETVTLPSVEDVSLWQEFDAVRIRMMNASQTGKPASRYKLMQKTASE
ncbi:MAG: SDR family oxidoreductase [Candidatus Obscuribacterales bacterium]|nr:SDR family oxidoreductase [Candidatus Obscuribacterales bacterium]